MASAALWLAERGRRRTFTAALALFADAAGFLTILRSLIPGSVVLRIEVFAAAFGRLTVTAAFATFTACPATILAAVAVLVRRPPLLPVPASPAAMLRFGAGLAEVADARAGAVAAVRLRVVVLLAATARCAFPGLPRVAAIFVPGITVRDVTRGVGFAVLTVRFLGAAAGFFTGILATPTVRLAPVWPA